MQSREARERLESRKRNPEEKEQLTRLREAALGVDYVGCLIGEWVAEVESHE